MFLIELPLDEIKKYSVDFNNRIFSIIKGIITCLIAVIYFLQIVLLVSE